MTEAKKPRDTAIVKSGDAQIIHLEHAKHLLAQAKTVPDVRRIRDQAELVRSYLRRQRAARDAANDAAEIRVRAENRMGELLSQMADAKTGPRKLGGYDPPNSLRAMGISKDESADCQKIASIPLDQFEAYISECREVGDEITTAGALRIADDRIRTEKRSEKIASVAATALPLGKFPVLYADPPWRYEHVKTESRAIENQYPTMDLAAIKALPINELATPDAVLFLWATPPKLAEAIEVLEAWGFTYRTCMVWVKDKIGMGYYARQRHELLLIAARGELPVPEPSARPDSVVTAPRGKHSEKPDEVRKLIEKMYPGLPWVELFVRQNRRGWAAWGNEVR